jgi:hypothetical protein
MYQYCIFYGLLLGIITSCTTLQNPSKYELADGAYSLKARDGKLDVYVENEADSILVYDRATKKPIETGAFYTKDTPLRLMKPSFDLDVVTTVFKIRPAQPGFNAQMNTNFNGSLYLGFRQDHYRLHRKAMPINGFKTVVNHVGAGFGLFTGLGSTVVTPSVTNNNIAVEYDGIVLQYGIASIFAINKLTLGIGIGLDHLLSSDRTWWIYDQKIWYGLTIGLNVN